MARAAAKPKIKTTTKLPSGSPGKKSPGRPPGSKNKIAVKRDRPLPAAAVSKRTASAKAAPAASKLSKADLEVQVVKLERALARSRKQVAELKLMVSESGARAEQAEPAKPSRGSAAKVSKGKAAKEKPVATRGRRKKVEQDAQDEPDDQAGMDGEAETEAHAS